MTAKKTAPAKAVVAKTETATPSVKKPVVNETVKTPTVNVNISVEGTEGSTVKTAKLGRPVDPNSPRQKALAEAQALREAGLLKRGRPVVEGSPAHQKALARAAKIQEKKVAMLATMPKGTKIEDITDEMVSEGRGRPVIPGSKHQKVLAMRAAKIANGIAIKPGRPKMEKVETPTTENK